MKKLFILLAIICFSELPLFAQQHTVSTTQETYTPLTGAGVTSLTNGQIWDEWSYVVQLGFPFTFGNVVFDSLYVDTNGFLILLEADLRYIRGFRTDLRDRGTTVSESDIRTELVGVPGNRIRKFEWQNAGFIDGAATDFVNFQIWLHEGSNDVSVHIGDWRVDSISAIFGEGGGPEIGLVYRQGRSTEDYFGYMLSGNPASPTAIQVNGDSTIYFLNGIPVTGTRYQFTSIVSGISTGQDNFDWIIFPNPTSRFLTLQTIRGNTEPFTVSIISQQGKRLLRQRFNGISNAAVDLSGLAKGFYLVEVVQGESTVYMRVCLT